MAFTSDSLERDNAPPREPAAETIRQWLNKVKAAEGARRQAAERVTDIYKDAKAEGIDVKMLRQMAKLENMDPEDRESYLLRLEAWAAMLKFY